MHLFLLIAGASAALILTYTSSIIVAALSSPVRSVPGPFWARFTRLWYFRRVYMGGFERDNIDLHRRYGRVVRVAPNMYSIDAPDAVNTIYSIASKMPKSEWYEGWKHPSPDRWTLFPDRNIKRHAETRRRFQALYSMSSLLGSENHVNECTDILQQRLAAFASTGATIDMTHWFQCYAFDVVGNITYSKRFGFLDRGDDVSGIIRALRGATIYSTMIGIYPAIHKYVYEIMNRLGIGGAVGRTHLMKFVGERIQQRKEERGRYAEKSVSLDENAPQDFLEKLMIQNEDNPQKVTSYHIFMMGLSNIIAGADTTAISLSAVLYYLIRSPGTMRALREELELYFPANDPDAKLTFKDTQSMDYLQAVIKEALRLHSATGLPLWRVVTESGLELDGYSFPPGSVIGLNTWVAHYNEHVFGPDAKEFKPRRWIDTKNEAQLKAMNAYYLPVSKSLVQESLLELTVYSLVSARERAWVGTSRIWKCPS
ncbi:hypothetical protein QQS21_012867 [Conoideocrella luteorostrata]|uniref:Cytochrome P450 n=1 Tax=Conoideocrella luteorostrata TaxID=1105319 RepID=A0AAJ0CAQ0_9HYPO|nr:hypothetical protein QQS21_012867 [Conoideocrella luteorostrata]